jgi:hypothetical protein
LHKSAIRDIVLLVDHAKKLSNKKLHLKLDLLIKSFTLQGGSYGVMQRDCVRNRLPRDLFVPLKVNYYV